MIGIKNEKWFETFFEGLATDIWRESISPEQTSDEIDFLIETLELAEGMQVLDVPCADGRLSLPLAERGIAVTGVDLSQRCIAAATADAGNRGLPLTYIQGDMRALTFGAQFDAGFCLGNSFAYFDRDGSSRFLRGVAKSLKPGARFVLDSCLAAETFFTVGGQREWTTAGGVYMLMDNEYDCRHGRLHSRFTFIHQGTVEEHETTHWIFTAAEICRMCEDAGLEVVALWGSLEGDRYELGSERFLLHLVKPKESI
jgi:SAM-dependent methyltransferase